MHKAHDTMRKAAPLKAVRDTSFAGFATWFLTLALVCAGCASAPASPPTPRVVTWEDKLSWMMRLEAQRVLRDPAPPARVVLMPATSTQPAVLAPAASL